MEELQNLIKFLKTKGLKEQKIPLDVWVGIIEYFTSKQETKQCDIHVVTTSLNVDTKISKKHRLGTIRYKSDFEFNHWIVEWDNGNWTREYGLDLNVW
jgi:hypothetical protein